MDLLARKESGQMLLIAMMIGLVLILAIPIVIFLNMTGTMHNVAGVKRDKGTAIAEEGISTAEQLLGANWAPALAGTSFPTECNSGTDVVGADGGHFRLACNITDPRRQSYQVYVKATAYLPGSNGLLVPTRAMEAFLSQKTLTVNTSTGYSASIAAQLGVVPNIASTAQFQTLWGPIVVQDTNTWNLSGVMDTLQNPRKFSVGAISGSVIRCSPDCTCAATTDQKEYWACTSIGNPTPINISDYKNSAQIETGITVFPSCSSGGTPAAWTTGNHGYFDVSLCPAGDSALFSSGYTVPNNATVIYVDNGNAQFGIPSNTAVAIDFKKPGANPGKGAFIVAGGSLTVNGTGFNFGNPDMHLRLPPTADKEYPYPGSGFNPSACPGGLGGHCDCSAVGGVTPCQFPFRGFLYVQGNMIVKNASIFYMDGVLAVDGQLQVQDSSIFKPHYDDEINRQIRTTVTPLQLQIDSMRDVPAN